MRSVRRVSSGRAAWSGAGAWVRAGERRSDGEYCGSGAAVFHPALVAAGGDLAQIDCDHDDRLVTLRQTSQGGKGMVDKLIMFADTADGGLITVSRYASLDGNQPHGLRPDRQQTGRSNRSSHAPRLSLLLSRRTMMLRYTIMLLVAVVALFAATTTFGAKGVLPACLTLGAVVLGVRELAARRYWRLAVSSFCSAGLVLLAMVLVLPRISGATAIGRVRQCRSNLRTIGLALHNYHDMWDRFPPAYIADESGQPAHSWRVLLLPLLEHLYVFRLYDFGEPWNGPNNSLLQSGFHFPEAFLCRSWPYVDSDGTMTTRYLAVIDRNSVWPGTESRSLSDIAVPEQTILIVECFHRAVPLLRPSDIMLDDAVAAPRVRVGLVSWWLGRTRRSRIVHFPEGDDGIRRYHEYIGRHALFADGSVRLLPNDLSAADFHALVDIRGVPKPVLPPPPSDYEAVPGIIQRLPFPPATIRWAGFVLFLAALAAMARLAIPTPTRTA